MKRSIGYLMIAGLFPVVAHAELLGRVNYYYGGDATKISEAQKAYDASLSKLKAAKDAKDDAKISTANLEYLSAEADLALANSEVQLSHPTSDSTGGKTGSGPISVSTDSSGAAQIGVAAYQYNLIMPWDVKLQGKKKIGLFSLDGKVDTNCAGDELACHRFVPIYFLMHKSLNTQVSSNTLMRDALDNDQGGLLNVKLTPSIWTSRNDTSKLAGGFNVMFDIGAKYVEAPAIDPKSVNFVGAGYGG